MADIENNLENLELALSDIETSIAGTESVSRAFRGEMEEMSRSMTTASREASSLSRSVGSSLKSAFDDLIFDGDKLSDVMKSLGRNIASKTFSSAITPVANALGGLVNTGVTSLVGGMLPFAKGGAFSGGRVRAFANGGVIDGPTPFPMRGGTGLMGEAGPEAIMPLTRGPDGTLGVRSGAGQQSVHVTMNITTPDVAGFKRSSSQIAAQMSRAMSRGNRNL